MFIHSNIFYSFRQFSSVLASDLSLQADEPANVVGGGETATAGNVGKGQKGGAEKSKRSARLAGPPEGLDHMGGALQHSRETPKVSPPLQWKFVMIFRGIDMLQI